MNGVADTSWLIAHFNRKDTFHNRARKMFAEADTVHIPAAVWAEFLNVFQYRFGGHTVALRARDELLRVDTVRLGDRLDDGEVATIWGRHPGLTYVDAAAVAEARRLRFELFTFDDDQAAAMAGE